MQDCLEQQSVQDWMPKTARMEKSRRFKRDPKIPLMMSHNEWEDSLSPQSRNGGTKSRLSTQRMSNILT